MVGDGEKCYSVSRELYLINMLFHGHNWLRDITLPIPLLINI